jgi:hypothetical protein
MLMVIAVTALQLTVTRWRIDRIRCAQLGCEIQSLVGD